MIWNELKEAVEKKLKSENLDGNIEIGAILISTNELAEVEIILEGKDNDKSLHITDNMT